MFKKKKPICKRKIERFLVGVSKLETHSSISNPNLSATVQSYRKTLVFKHCRNPCLNLSFLQTYHDLWWLRACDWSCLSSIQKDFVRPSQPKLFFYRVWIFLHWEWLGIFAIAGCVNSSVGGGLNLCGYGAFIFKFL